MNYDLFNGDADGILSLLQLRKAQPIDSVLVTGVKRKIDLMRDLNVSCDDKVTVLDVSMEKNADALQRVLELGCSVFYADHHKTGTIPSSNNLDAHIDLDPNMCTALIIDQYLSGQYHEWAIAAAFGDNLVAKARQLSLDAGLTNEQMSQVEELGVLINYNGYGDSLDDLHYHPKDLYMALMQYASPFDVIADIESPYHRLKDAYDCDMSAAQTQKPEYESDRVGVYILPNNATSRRVSGVFGNWLANEAPDKAHAVFTENGDGTYKISLRAPLNNKQGAGDICSQFATGGGRAAAAGVNALPRDQVDVFIQAVDKYYNI